MKIAIFAISLAAAAAGQTFPLPVRWSTPTSGSTMKRVRVALNPYGVRGREMAVVTREDGRFSFDVPRGKYVLTAEYRGTRQPFGLSGPGIGFNVALFTGPDQDTSNLVFRWFPLGAITGKVVDDRGEPANGVLVQLIRASVNLGRRRLVSAGWLYTNDVGEYRFYPVTGGTYYLVVTGAPWYATRGRPVFSVEDGSVTPVDTTNQASPAYAPAYYPNAIDISGASPLSVAPGAEVHADFTLRTINGVNVHVHSPNAKRGSGMLSLLADGIEGVQGFQRQASLTGESQTIFSVPPGRYTVRIAGSGDNPFSGAEDHRRGRVGRDGGIVDAARAHGYWTGDLQESGNPAARHGVRAADRSGHKCGDRAARRWPGIFHVQEYPAGQTSSPAERYRRILHL